MVAYMWLYAVALFLSIPVNALFKCKADVYANGCSTTSITLQRHSDTIMSVRGETQAEYTFDNINQTTVIRVTSDRYADGKGCLMATIDVIAMDNGEEVERRQIYTADPIEDFTPHLVPFSDPYSFSYFNQNTRRFSGQILDGQAGDAKFVFDDNLSFLSAYVMFSANNYGQMLKEMNCDLGLPDGECYGM